MAELLNMMEHELTLFDKAERPDYEIFQAIADYFLGFPDRCHHPKEDVLLERMKERDPAWCRAAVELDAEHRNLARLALDFSQAVHNVLNDAEVPRSAFHRVARQFIDCQRRHMQFEEEVFFPAAIETLTPEDWARIERETPAADPLFGDVGASRFGNLRERLLRWKRHDAAARAAAERTGGLT